MTNVTLLHFLLIYDRRRGSLAEDPREFSDAAAAAHAYERAEWEHRGNRDLEIVLIGADSLDTVRQTHRNYFANDDAMPFAGAHR